MQGKERNQNSEIDKQFVNTAWSNMSELLDREMPVVVVPPKSNNKRYLTLLLLLMVGFLMGIGAMAIMDEEKEIPVVQPPVVTPIPSNIPIANATKPANLKLESESEVIVNNQTTIEKESIAKTMLLNEKSSTKSVDVAISNISNQIVTTVDQDDQKTLNESIPFHANEKVDEPVVVYSEFYKKRKNNVKIVDQSLPNIENGGVVTNEMKTSPEKENNTVITENVLPEGVEKYLATADILDLPRASMSELDSKERTIERAFILPKKSPWKVAAIGGVHMVSGYSGWEAGMLAEYQLNPRFAIQSGLTLKTLKKDTYLDVFNTSTFNYPFQVEGAGNIVTDPNLSIGDLENNSVQEYTNGSRVYLERLNYVNTPLLLAYQPTSYLKVLLGMNLAYRFDFIDQIIGDATNKSSDNDERSIIEFSADESFSSNSLNNGIRKTDVSGVFGIGFYPTKNTGIDLRYHLGFQDYTNDSYFTPGKVNNNHSLQLSLIHYFGK